MMHIIIIATSISCPTFPQSNIARGTHAGGFYSILNERNLTLDYNKSLLNPESRVSFRLKGIQAIT